MTLQEGDQSHRAHALKGQAKAAPCGEVGLGTVVRSLGLQVGPSPSISKPCSVEDSL